MHDSPDGNIYSLSWYQDIVAPRWDGVVKQSDGSGYRSVMTVPHYRKFGLPYVRMPHFANQLGVISRESVLVGDFTEALNIVQSNFRYILNYPMNLANEDLVTNPATAPALTKPFSIVSHQSYEIDLKPPYEVLYDNFTPDRKKNIKKSLRENLVVNESTDIEQLIRHHKRFTAPRIYGGVTDHQYDLLRRLYSGSRERGLGSLFDVSYQGETIASCFFLFFKQRIIKFCNVSTTEGRKRNADSFLMQTLLERWANQDKVFDFERASLPGINHYKESFGARKKMYSSINYNNLPGFIKAIKQLRVRLLTPAPPSLKR